MRWRRGTCGFIGWCRQWCVMRCLLDVRMAGDEMMRCSCPVSHRHSFPFRPTPSCELFLACGPHIIPRPRGVGGANGRSICGCGRDGDLLAFYRFVSLSRLRSFAIVSPAVRVFIIGSPCSPFLSSGLVRLRRAPSPVLASLRVPCPVRFLFRSCFRPISSVGFGRLFAPCSPVLSLAIAWRCRVISSMRCFASPRRRRLSASRRPCVSSSLLGSSRASSRRVSSFLRLVRRPACFAHLGMRCRPVGRGGLPLRYASRPACSCRRVGAIVAGSSWPPACLPVRSFVAIVCCLSLFVYIVP